MNSLKVLWLIFALFVVLRSWCVTHLGRFSNHLINAHLLGHTWSLLKQKVLGEGTFATVRRAVHVKSGLEFAVKCLDKQQIEKQKMGKQLKREVAIMRIIKHPRVVQFYEVLASKTKIYLVLELVTGGELFNLLVKERGFGEDKARFFFRQLVEGVTCCHEKGICHRDLKPENLLLDENCHLKISDFGLSALHNHCGEATLTSSKMLHTSELAISLLFKSAFENY